MNDEKLEHYLRELPAPELPATWRSDILGNALRESRALAQSREVWPVVLIYLRNIFARNPYTTTVLFALWALIFLFKATTPVDPSEKELLAHFDPNRPVYLVSLQDEILLAELLQEQPDQRPSRLIP